MLIKRIFVFLFVVSVTVLMAFQISGAIEKKLRFVYITDLNLYHTPNSTQTKKHINELKNGILVYESQAIFQELIRELNKKINPDFIVFGGNNISDSSPAEKLWQLFLDISSEINTDLLICFGKNEIKNYSTFDLSKSLSNFSINSTRTWYSKMFGDYLFIVLDTVSLLNNKNIAIEQLNWLKSTLLKNKHFITVIIVADSFFYSHDDLSENKYFNSLEEIISQNPQVKLVLSGGNYLNRSSFKDSTVYLDSASTTVYPCTFRIIELGHNELSVQTLPISLKGVIKKAEKSILDSDLAKNSFPSSPVQIKAFLSGHRVEQQFTRSF